MQSSQDASEAIISLENREAAMSGLRKMDITPELICFVFGLFKDEQYGCYAAKYPIGSLKERWHGKERAKLGVVIGSVIACGIVPAILTPSKEEMSFIEYAWPYFLLMSAIVAITALFGYLTTFKPSGVTLETHNKAARLHMLAKVCLPKLPQFGFDEKTARTNPDLVIQTIKAPREISVKKLTLKKP